MSVALLPCNAHSPTGSRSCWEVDTPTVCTTPGPTSWPGEGSGGTCSEAVGGKLMGWSLRVWLTVGVVTVIVGMTLIVIGVTRAAMQ